MQDDECHAILLLLKAVEILIRQSLLHRLGHFFDRIYNSSSINQLFSLSIVEEERENVEW